LARLLWKIPVSVLGIPINETTFAALDPQMVKDFQAYLAAQAGPGVRLIGPALSGWPDALFGDKNAHLNSRGARAFSRELSRCADALRRQHIASMPPPDCQAWPPPRL
jgi:hypothetical protein